MEYYIDGHNLIPKLPGISLSEDGDEEKLLERIQEFARLSRRKCTVFFDKAPENRTKNAHYGTVQVVYVTHHYKADEEIIARVNKAGARVKEITVVSSDQHVQWQSHQAGASVMPSEKFAAEMEKIFLYGKSQEGGHSKMSPQMEAKLSSDEVEEWLRIFNNRE